MRMQLSVAKIVFKKCFKFILLFLMFSFSYLLVMKLSKGLDFNDFKTLLGYIDLNNADFLGILLGVYQYALIVYFTYLFYSFEIRENMYNIFLRINIKKLFAEKLFFQLLIVFVFRIMFSFLLILLFSNNLEHYQTFLLSNIIMFLAISILSSVFYNHVHNKFLFLFVIVLMCFIETVFYNYMFIFNILICIVVVLYDLFIFNFKKALIR